MFGPIGEENTLLANGKRLRVETESIRRPGGVFTGSSGGRKENPGSEMIEGELAVVIRPGANDEETQRVVIMQDDSSDGGMNRARA